jgi:mRNA interferase RelE/StbE
VVLTENLYKKNGYKKTEKYNKISGKALKADVAGLWRYRVGDYRTLCQIKDGELLALVVALTHRRNVHE